MEEHACNLCGAGAAQARRVLRGPFPLVRCSECGLIFVWPRPAREEIGSWYPPDYRPHREVGDEDAKAGRARRSRRWAFLEAMRPGRVLSVGCGSGSELVALMRAGWEAYGIEIVPEAAKQARRLGIRVFVGPAEEADFGGVRFDVVAAFHSLEHLHDPFAALRRLRQMAAPAARLVVEVPNVAGLNFRLFGERWSHLERPRHLYFFSPPTMRALAERAGWKLAGWRCRSGTRGLRRSWEACWGPMVRRAWVGPLRAFGREVARVVDLMRWGDVAQYHFRAAGARW